MTQGTQAELELVIAQPPLQELAEDRTPAAAVMSQWQLIRRRFAKHKLAVGAMYVLSVLYLMAIFAEFVSPYTPNTRNIDFSYCPPQLPRFSLAHGFHTLAMKSEIDPITFRRTYVEMRDNPVKLGFFAKGASYRFWGLIPMNRHLIGATSPGTFHFLGADKYGRDIFSRIVYGARISLSVGLI